MAPAQRVPTPLQLGQQGLTCSHSLARWEAVSQVFWLVLPLAISVGFCHKKCLRPQGLLVRLAVLQCATQRLPTPWQLGEQGTDLAKVEADAVSVHPLCLEDEVPRQARPSKLLPTLRVAALREQFATRCIDADTCKRKQTSKQRSSSGSWSSHNSPPGRVVHPAAVHLTAQVTHEAQFEAV